MVQPFSGMAKVPAILLQHYKEMEGGAVQILEKMISRALGRHRQGALWVLIANLALQTDTQVLWCYRETMSPQVKTQILPKGAGES